MDYKELKAHRTVLLDLYKSLGKALEIESDEIPESIKQSRENIAEEKFLLAIVGEVKAGKSTFINAILGEAILPYDTLQATSEIVEIYHSDKKEVQVTFANGKTQAVEDDPQTPENEAVPFLKKIASINEEYRGIPIVQVNRFLIDHYSEAKGKAVFEKSELEYFISDPDLENIYKLETEEFRDKIRKYIVENISCDEIPERVTLGYPHEFSAFKHFRIVDTPGINAIGGIENQTKKFIKHADAVIYLHHAKQLESKALRNALENELPERVKDRLVLVLTHRSEKFYPGEDEHERILEETQRLYPEIGSDDIFFVDSLTELYLKAFYGKSMDEINAMRRQDVQLRRLTSDCVEVADGNENDLLDLLEAQSNFTQIRERIEKDAQNSASIQMKDFADAIQEEYEVLDNNIRAKIEPLKKNYRDPQSFASDIQKQKNEIETMRRDYNKFTSELREEFSPHDMNSGYYHKIDQVVNNYINKVNNKKFNSDHHTKKAVEAYVEKLLYEDFSDTMTRFIDSLKADFKKRIADRNIEAQSDYSITVPIISLGSIWDTALDAANKKIKKQVDKVDNDRGFFSGLFHLVTLFVFDDSDEKKAKIRKTLPQQLWKEMQSPIVNQLVTNKTELQESIDQLINNFCDRYQGKFNGKLLKRKQYMEQLEKGKKTNEELEVEIASLLAEKKTIEDNTKMCIKIKGEL